MHPDRRTVLKGLLAAAAGVSGLAAFPARRASAGPSPAVEGTTLDTTVVRGAADNPQGYVRLASGGGEAHAVRDELGTVARPGREGRRVGLLAFVHLTDIHVIDAQSPGRVEFLDRYNDGPGEPLFFGSAYRPQEFLTPHVSDSLVAAVERVGIGPVSSRLLDFAVCTGDNTDNAQLNELRWGIDVLDGVRPSGPTAVRRTASRGCTTRTRCRTTSTTGTRTARRSASRRTTRAGCTASLSCPVCSTRRGGRSPPAGCPSPGSPATATTTAWCRATSRSRCP